MLMRPDVNRNAAAPASTAAPDRMKEARAPVSEVTDDPAGSRFEMASGGAVAFVAYERAGGGRVAPLHTEVPAALSGQGVGSKLVRGVLDALRAEGAKVVPRCEFMAAHVERHPEYRDLLADEG